VTQPAAPQGLTPGAVHAAAKRVRLCALTRVEKPVEELIRFVLGPGAAIAPDLANKLGGRGVWVTATRTALEQAIKRNVFAKSLKTQAKPEQSLPDLVDRQIVERMRQALSFASKAGLVTTGFVKVEAAIETEKVAVLVQANDAADDGTARLKRKFEAIAAVSGRRAPLSRHFTSDELSMALGRTNVVHAALAEGGQTSAFLRESLRLERFRLNDEIENDASQSASPPDTASGGPIGLDTDKV
jgi:uncharacterized protein